VALERWNPPRREVVLFVQLAAARHVITMKWGGRYAIESMHFRFRTTGWDGEWKLHAETLIAQGRAATPFHGPQVASVPEWLANLREKALLEVQLHG
jgi:hypothetical protein